MKNRKDLTEALVVGNIVVRLIITAHASHTAQTIVAREANIEVIAGIRCRVRVAVN